MSNEDGITLRPEPDELAAWTRAAGEQPLPEWLASVANAAAMSRALERTWPVVVKLKHPVKLGSEAISELSIRRGRVGDVKGLKLSSPLSSDVLITVASRLTAQPTQVIDALDLDDSDELMEIVSHFLARVLGGRTR